MTDKTLKIENLCVEVEEKEVLKNVNFEFKKGEINVILGPNGAGKSTIANILMGNPQYKIKRGNILLNNEKINNLSSDLRAKKGIFLSFQSPVEIDGVMMLNFLQTSYNQIKDVNINLRDFLELLDEKSKKLNFGFDFKSRNVNSGFSGGEKKKSEILQMLLLEPEFIILDEIDSGLDVDSLKTIISVIDEYKQEKEVSLILITHNNKILETLIPNNVYVLGNGEIVKKGGREIISEIDLEGFSKI